MGSNYAEKEGCRQILHKLEMADLLSLYNTVVKSTPSVHNKAELIERIIEKSNTPAELLNRRKVYKNIILQYLNSKHIFMDARSTKNDAMQKALESWKCQAKIQPSLLRFVDGSTPLGATFGVQNYALDGDVDGEKHHFVRQEETKVGNKAELMSIKLTKDEAKDYYVKHEERKAATKAELGSVKETNDGEKDRHIQQEETKSVNKEAPGSVKEIKDGPKDYYIKREEKKAAIKEVLHQLMTTKTEKSPTTTPQTCKDYNTEFKGASIRYIKEASQNCVPSSCCEILPYMKHLIKLISDQQNKQDQQYHILQQVLDMQKENSEQLKDLKEAQQIDQHEVLLLQLKENKKHQLSVTDLLQEIKDLIQQQNNVIFLQLQQQQQDFQAKLIKDLTKKTEEQVKVLLQDCYKCKPHETSYNKQSPYEEVPSIDTKERERFHCELMGEEFCNWFYPLWNSLNPSYGQAENIVWGPQVFWANATAEMINYVNERQDLQRYEGVECVSDFLLNLIKQERQEFRPSIDNERFKCVNSKHGLVVVAVNGTIFRDQSVTGIFEQVFGLIQCPETKIFKIKFANLKTKYFNHINDPLSVPPLSYTTEQLENM